MSEVSENTFTAYLGPEFQLRLMWQLLVEPEFTEKVIPDLAVEYFDDPNLKRLFIIILEFFKEYEKVPNLQNQSIYHAINKYKPKNPIEEESLFSIVKKIKLWNERVLNKDLFYDGDVVQKQVYEFIKQQEYRKTGEYILEKTRTGEIKQKFFIGNLEEKLQKIGSIGDEEDYGTEITEGVSKALRREFRETIPTGVDVLDNVTGGGLGKGEIGLILSPSGVGKTTLLTKIANTAYEHDYNVLQIIFEDSEDQIKRKHYAIWTEYKLSEFDANNKDVEAKVIQKIQEHDNKGKLVIKKFSQENTTMITIKKFVQTYEKKHGYKFDMIVLDYLDCLEPHKKSVDRNEAELAIVKSFESMAGDYNIPCWTAIQSNRSGFGSEYVEAYQTGGSIKRLQKAHFFMSIAKTPAQQEAGLANIRILKARFAKDGQAFEDCVFDNDKMQILIKDNKYNQPFRGRKKYDDEDIDKLTEKVRKTKTTTTDIISRILDNLDKSPLPPINNELPILNVKQDTVNDGVSEGVNDGVNDTQKMEVTKTDEETLNKITELDETGFTWTGETMTVNKGEEPEIEITENEDNTITVKGTLLELNDKPNKNNRVYASLTDEEVSEIENKFTEDEEISDDKKHVFDYIVKASQKQGVIKKE